MRRVLKRRRGPVRRVALEPVDPTRSQPEPVPRVCRDRNSRPLGVDEGPDLASTASHAKDKAAQRTAGCLTMLGRGGRPPRAMLPPDTAEARVERVDVGGRCARWRPRAPERAAHRRSRAPSSSAAVRAPSARGGNLTESGQSSSPDKRGCRTAGKKSRLARRPHRSGMLVTARGPTKRSGRPATGRCRRRSRGRAGRGRAAAGHAWKGCGQVTLAQRSAETSAGRDRAGPSTGRGGCRGSEARSVSRAARPLPRRPTRDGAEDEPPTGPVSATLEQNRARRPAAVCAPATAAGLPGWPDALRLEEGASTPKRADGRPARGDTTTRPVTLEALAAMGLSRPKGR